jgi:hypothetical protein
MDKVRPGERIVEAGLWLVAGLCAFWSALWIAGVNGFGWIASGDLPHWLDPITFYGRTGQWTANPSVPVRLDRVDSGGIFDYYVQRLNDGFPNQGQVPAHWGELLPGASVVQLWDVTLLQQISYQVLQLAGFVAIAFIAITLAKLVADSRGESPFSQQNVIRLHRIGLVVLIGAPLASLGHWAVERWMVESSSMGDRVSLYPYHWSSLPWWTMLVGAAVLVLADVWRRGVRMASDVEGLV